MYNGPGPVIVGGGVVGGVLAHTGFHSLVWAVGAAVLLTVGLVFVRLGSLARAKRD